MRKIFLFDFDGTLVTENILDVICDIVGKKEESRKINEKVRDGNLNGLELLCERINFLQGVSYQKIKNKLDEENYLRKGARELFEFLKGKEFITILSSGNIMPVLKYYQELLGIDYIFGAMPQMNGEVIGKITVEDFKARDFKYNSCLEIINRFDVKKENIYGIGDSATDVKMLSLAGHKFAINPKGGLQNKVDIVIKDDLMDIVQYL